MNEPKKSTVLNKLLRRFERERPDLEDKLDSAIDTHAEETGEPVLDTDARSMVKNVIGFADTRVKDLMVPRANIIAVDEEITLGGLLAKFIEAGHSRLPIFRESLDDITGMVHVKDYLSWLASHSTRKKSKAPTETNLTIKSREFAKTLKEHPNLRRDVLFVPPSMPAPDLLLKMKTSRVHIAVVVDEYGGTDGLVSMENLVEVIIGDIADEHDEDDQKDMITRVDAATYLANARVEIEKVDEALGVKLMPDESEGEAKTLAGVLFELAGRVPIRGEIIKHASGVEFEVTDSDARRIKRVRIRLRNLPETGLSEAETG